MFSLEGSIIIIVAVLWKKAAAVIQMLGKLPNKNVILFFFFQGVSVSRPKVNMWDLKVKRLLFYTRKIVLLNAAVPRQNVYTREKKKSNLL